MNAQIKWDKSGNYYLILISNSVAVFSISEDKAISTINFEEKVTDFAFIDKVIVNSVTKIEAEGESSDSDQELDKNSSNNDENQPKQDLTKDDDDVRF